MSSQLYRLTAKIIYRRWKLLYSCIFYIFSLIASTVYFYLYNKIGNITGNVYVDTVLPFIVDLPLTWSAIVVNKCLGRRWCTFLYAVASGFALLSVMILHMTGNLQSIPTMVTGLCMFGKLGVTASFSLISVMAIEMYPTVIRCMGTAIGVAFTAAGSILSRQFKFLDAFHYTIPFVVFGGFIITVGFSALILPETIGKPLPNILPCRHRKIPLTEGARLFNPWESV
ncbi:organic cation/carnitine transporter 2 [Patella vulgata]|uniref:organic cation/carnitine transporter 2 n=1 Tax=Patella vulgata TaxID=6465 RepID=UPI0024A8FFB0|nr:organic cation/carnitine transporter 2 [Patella vulgata]